MKLKFKNFLIICFLLFSLFIKGDFSLAQTEIQDKLDKIETEVWGFTHNSENDIERIERIEKQTFGTTNPKLTADKRIEKINKALGLETYEEAKSSLAELYVQEKPEEGVEYPQIDRLEGVLLGSVYKNESITDRIERLEKKVFGAKQQGDLAQRTEALQKQASASFASEKMAEKHNNYRPQNSYTPSTYEYAHNGEDVKMQIAAMENVVFAMDYSQDPIPLRLTRLENKIFQRDFADDDPVSRIQRIQAAASASRTAKQYDNNKFQKFAATGMQAASFLLMILAFIL